MPGMVTSSVKRNLISAQFEAKKIKAIKKELSGFQYSLTKSILVKDEDKYLDFGPSLNPHALKMFLKEEKMYMNLTGKKLCQIPGMARIVDIVEAETPVYCRLTSMVEKSMTVHFKIQHMPTEDDKFVSGDIAVSVSGTNKEPDEKNCERQFVREYQFQHKFALAPG